MINIVEPHHETLTPPASIWAMPKRLERAGRTCYKSEANITEDSADKFVRMICRRNHVSVLEHESISVRITCSRACSHQLVRHRLAAYSQESQRYCNYGKKGFQFIVPETSRLVPGVYDTDKDGFWHLYPNEGAPVPVYQDLTSLAWLRSLDHSMRAYEYNVGHQRPEDARYLLPNATKTEVVTTMNLRMWRHVIQERALNPAAQWEIRDIFQGIFYQLRNLLPSVFDDLTETVS